MSLHPEPDYVRKLVVVGDGGCGKTCLLMVFARKPFPEGYCPTVFENYITNVQRGSKVVELALWDTAGQEEYDRLRPLSYPESDVVLICFAVDSQSSLANVQDKWYPEVRHFCPHTPVLLVGLKNDLRKSRKAIELLRAQGESAVTFQEASAVAAAIGAKYCECSAIENQGVDRVFHTAIDLAISTNYHRFRRKYCTIL